MPTCIFHGHAGHPTPAERRQCDCGLENCGPGPGVHNKLHSVAAPRYSVLSVRALWVVLLLLCARLNHISALENGLGRRPLMGWSSWNAFAASEALNETTVLKVMEALVDRPDGGPSLLDRGYRYVNLDDGIVLPTRDSGGRLVVDSQRFPRGLAFLAQQAHIRGLLFGVYTARGLRTCCGKAGSLGHEDIDAQVYATEWKVDYLKNDGCTGGRQLPGVENASAVLYGKMRDAINRTGRKIFLNIKQDIVPGGFGAACALANSFRIADDIKPCQGESGLISDIAANALRFAGPGCYLDLDSLEVGVNSGCPNEPSNVSSNELTRQNWKAQLALWAVISAQLVLGNDLTTMSTDTRELLMSPGYIAVNQDAMGVPGRLLRIGDRNSAELWGKPLVDRSFACVLWFRNQTQAIQHRESRRLHSGSIELDFRDLGFEGSAEVIDVWTNTSHGIFNDSFDWAATAEYLGAAEFVYVRPVEGASRRVGCSVWGGSCSTARAPNKDGMFWSSDGV